MADDSRLEYSPPGELPTLSLVAPDHLITISSEGRTLVTVDLEGNVEYGEHYDPDEAARTFWQALAEAGVLAWAAAMEAAR